MSTDTEKPSMRATSYLEQIPKEDYERFKAYMDANLRSDIKKHYSNGVNFFLRYLHSKRVPYDSLKTMSSNELKQLLNDFILIYLRTTRHLKPGTINVYYSGVKCFLNTFRSDVDMMRVRFRPKRSAPPPPRKVLTKEQLKTILSSNFMKTDLRAFALFMLSSGARASTIARLRLKDVDLEEEEDVGIVYIPGESESGELITKTAKSYITFITSEAKEQLRLYLKAREINLGRKLTPEDKLFPLEVDKIRERWDKILERLGIVYKRPGSLMNDYTLHNLRYFFETQCIKAGIPAPAVMRLMCHSAKDILGTGDVYVQFNLEELLSFYRKAIPYLTVLK